jgi:hypothetical protein
VVEPAAAGDQSQRRVAGTGEDRAVGELVLRVGLHQVDGEHRLGAVLTVDGDAAARFEPADLVEDRRARICAVDVPDDRRRPDLTRTRAQFEPSCGVGALKGRDLDRAVVVQAHLHQRSLDAQRVDPDRDGRRSGQLDRRLLARRERRHRRDLLGCGDGGRLWCRHRRQTAQHQSDSAGCQREQHRVDQYTGGPGGSSAAVRFRRQRHCRGVGSRTSRLSRPPAAVHRRRTGSCRHLRPWPRHRPWCRRWRR